MYKVHVGVFLMSTIIFFSSLLFINYSHFFKKYYSYNEFYKLQVMDIFNISICLTLLFIIIAQLLLPVNFIWSLFKTGSIKQETK